MLELARDGFTGEEIKRALHGPDGSRKIRFRYELIANGVKKCDLSVLAGEVQVNRENEIKRTARFTIRHNSQINWLTDTIKPYIGCWVTASRPAGTLTWGDLGAESLTWDNLDSQAVTLGSLDAWAKQPPVQVSGWAEWPLGVYVPSTPEAQYENGARYYEVECYDKTVILREDCLTERLFLPKGTLYIDAAMRLLYDAGAVNVKSDDCNLTLQTNREFEIGITKLSVLNQLMQEINFNPVETDQDGVFILRRYREPSVENVSYTYEAGALSVICEPAKVTADFYAVPNVFIGIVSNSELESDLKSVYVNDNPASPLSTVCRGRKIVAPVYRPDAVAGQKELDDYIRRIAFEANQIEEQLDFDTAAMPMHGIGDVLNIRHPAAEGIFVETGWSMELSAGKPMHHTVRRLTAL